MNVEQEEEKSFVTKMFGVISLVPLITLTPPLLLLLLAAYLKFRFDHKDYGHRLPPRPPKLPIIGNLHQLTSETTHRSLRDSARKNGYNDLMLFHFGTVRALIVSSAEAAREVMKTQDLVFANRPPSPMAKHLIYNCRGVIFGPYGEYWRQAKKICTLHLLSAKRVESFKQVREQGVDAMIEKIVRLSRKGSEAVNLSDILHSLANDVVSSASIGKNYGEKDDGGKNEFCWIVKEMSELFGESTLEDYFPYLSWMNAFNGMNARIERCRGKIDGFLNRVLQDRLNGCSGSKGIIDVLLESDRLGFSLTKDEIKAITLDMFAAGTDTSFILLEWTMAELIRNPRLMSKAHEEVRRVAGGKPRATEADTTKMTYLSAVIKESLRLHPPVPLLLPRETTAETQVHGYTIPAKTRVIVNAWSIGRDPRYWEEPEEFKPERFIGSDVDYNGQDFRYVPFGSGRRMCPGISFAMCSVKLSLANLLLVFDWELPGGKRGEYLDMTEAKGLTVRRNTPLLVVAKKIDVSE